MEKSINIVRQKNNINANSDIEMDRTFILLAVYGIVILLVMNIFEIVSFWLGGKSRQIFVKNLIGVKKVHIYKSIFGVFNGLIFFSFIIGFLLSCLFSRLISYENFAINIDFSVCFVSLAFSILVENFALILSLFKKLKNGFMELKTT